jgi:uncharacterized protein
VLLDANILIYAVDEASQFHGASRTWLEDVLNGHQRVGIPWQSVWAFLRIATNARALADPLSAVDAWEIVEGWVGAPATWVPQPGERHKDILGGLLVSKDLRGNLVADAVLAALCIEHGMAIVSADSDFARFPEVRWINPIA